jgi:hypothetical protein
MQNSRSTFLLGHRRASVRGPCDFPIMSRPLDVSELSFYDHGDFAEGVHDGCLSHC